MVSKFLTVFWLCEPGLPSGKEMAADGTTMRRGWAEGASCRKNRGRMIGIKTNKTAISSSVCGEIAVVIVQNC